MQSAGRVENHDVVAVLLRLSDGSLANGDGIFRTRLRVHLDAELLADHVQLLDGRGALQVGRNQERLFAALFDQAAELTAGGRFAGALQAAHHQHGHAGLQVQRVIDRPHQLDELVMHDAHDLLAGIERR